MEFDVDMDNWLASHAYSLNTEDRYRRALRQFFEEVEDIAGLDAAGLAAWLGSHGWGSSMQWVTSIAVKGFLRWKFGASHPALSLRLKREEPPPQRVLRLPAIRHLLESFDTSSAKGKRDLAMAGLMLDSGLRVSEVCRLETRWVEYDRRLDSYFLRVIVKGGYWAMKTFSQFTAAWVNDWLAARSMVLERLGKSDPGKTFIGIGGKTPGEPMTRNGLQVVVRRWGERAGIGRLSPHDLRRSMASNATAMGAPEDVVMKAGGWKSETVFRRYTVGVGLVDMKRYFPTSGAMGD